MSKFLTWNFAGVLVIVSFLFVLHELGHYLAYRILGYQATVRKSIIAPGIDPKETITIPRLQGLFIAISGFAFSTIIVIVPLFIVDYQYWFVILIGSVVGTIVDLLWAISMLSCKTVTIHARTK